MPLIDTFALGPRPAITLNMTLTSDTFEMVRTVAAVALAPICYHHSGRSWTA